ncbi:hypothetical protein HPB48_022743 [Haemaphysalis longicornis]|uniref:Tick transposon n=1 Tax=Haemaphysalis longicornis TaxID=44386 RepID=A0A9J6FZ98_HAELO|nr:hypothetical protein HPB48_022743 [Haemaphysalis longicornis]
MEQDQVKLISSVNEIKNNQEAIERKVNDIDRRLAAVEAKACDNAEVGDELLQLRQLTDHLSRENARLHDEHSQLEDRMRRSNLLFYGLTDCPQEKWNQTEEKLVKEITTVFKSPVPSEAFERVHRLGTYRPNQNRPVIAKFASFKLKQELLSLSGKFKENGITVSEDYSLQTRQVMHRRTAYSSISLLRRARQIHHNAILSNLADVGVGQRVYHYFTYCLSNSKSCVFSTKVRTPHQSSIRERRRPQATPHIQLQAQRHNIPRVPCIRELGLRLQADVPNSETIPALHSSTGQISHLFTRNANTHHVPTKVKHVRLVQAFINKRIGFVAPFLVLN